MKNVTVIDRRTGAARSMQRRYADLLVKLGRAEYQCRGVRVEAEGDGEPGAQKEAKKASKRAYKRRDMKAED